MRIDRDKNIGSGSIDIRDRRIAFTVGRLTLAVDRLAIFPKHPQMLTGNRPPCLAIQNLNAQRGCIRHSLRSNAQHNTKDYAQHQRTQSAALPDED